MLWKYTSGRKKQPPCFYQLKSRKGRPFKSYDDVNGNEKKKIKQYIVQRMCLDLGQE